jgi:hypothetical protein
VRVQVPFSSMDCRSSSIARRQQSSFSASANDASSSPTMRCRHSSSSVSSSTSCGCCACCGAPTGVLIRSVTRQNRCGAVALSSASNSADCADGGVTKRCGALLVGEEALPSPRAGDGMAAIIVETGVAGAYAAAFEPVALPFLAPGRVTYTGCSTVNTLLAGGSPDVSQFQQAPSSKMTSLDACTRLVEGSKRW